MPFCLVENLKNMGMLKNFPIYINDWNAWYVKKNYYNCMLFLNNQKIT
jgi:hypothetical protein